MRKLLYGFAFLFVGILSAGMLAGTSQATVVQFTYDCQVDGLFGPVNNYRIQLFDSQAPITVSNFLRLVNNHDYEGTIIHRDVPEFVMQGGGYVIQVDDQDNIVALNPNVSYGWIQNEFSSARPNVRGTIAMAKQGGNPNSASNQWYVNLSNNSALDDPNNNGGYTVFGRVVGEGMRFIDGIDLLPTYNINPWFYPGYDPNNPTNGPFSDVPLFNDGSSLVIVDSASVVPTVQWLGGVTTGATNWGLTRNWSPSTAVPDGAGVSLVLGGQASANNTLDMISGRTVGNIYYSSYTSTTIQSTGNYNLTLDNNGDASTINVLGNQTIAAPVILNDNVIISGDGTLTLSGGISGSYTMALLGGNIITKNLFVDGLIFGDGVGITIQHSGGALGGAIMPIPEPSALVLLGIGAFGMLAFGWRRFKQFMI